MKISELLLERRIQRVETLYHGTSTLFLRSILKYGLVMNPPKRTFSRDTDFEQQGYDSYEGVYLARIEDYAEEAADWAIKAHGGERLLITVQAVVGSSLTDEDDITGLFLTAISKMFRKTKKLSEVTEIMKTITGDRKTTMIDKSVHDMMSNSEDFGGYRLESGLDFRFSPASKPALSSILYKSIDILVTAGENTPNTDTDFYIEFYLLPKLRYDPEYENAMQVLLKGIRVKNSKSVRMTRNIGFSGKTRILEIKNLDTGVVIYPKVSQRKGLAKRADYYFFGNPSMKYAWGIGRTPAEAIDDGERAFEEYDESNPGETTWEEELRVCRVYPTDKFTYEQIEDDGYQIFTVKNGLVVAKP
jgi:hypothetical protein